MKEKEEEKKNNDQAEEVVRWESLLPRMVLRVLLVEADHSTRQIITALLRKCSYTVTAVPDGLKAWETLKRKAPDLDLILTEVDLPAISGFALLTLIMEHDFCKNIPVIMMSSHDSVSMVLKCMLKGAADFLIKPVRRNELKNLWQHVWRRHAICGSLQNTTFQQKKLNTASQDNSASNQSSGSVASSQKNNACSEKWSEAQSTCTSPFLEAESAYMQNMHDVSQLKSSSKSSNIDAVKHEESTKFEKESTKHDVEKGVIFVSEAAWCNEALKSTDLRLEQNHGCAETKNEDGVLRAKLRRAKPNISMKIRGSSDELVEPSRDAINLIATFENLSKHTNEKFSLSGGNSNKFGFDTQLELSLRRDFPGSSSKQASEATEERQTLNHSNTSAFSWYSGSKLLQPFFPPSLVTSAKVNTDRHSHEAHKLSGNTVDTYDVTNQNPGNMNTPVMGQSGQFRPKLPNSQHEVAFDLKSGGHGSVFTPVFYAPSDVRPIWNPKPVCQKESSPFPTSTSSQSNPESHNSEQHCHWSDDATYASLDQNVHEKTNLDHARHDSPAAGQSAGNSLCHDSANCINRACGSMSSASDGNATSTVVTKSHPESLSDDGYHNYDGFRGTNSHRSTQREAALTKFRLKRKERCYEKKVRYQSRKKLAEQRPRVKGQFVRQVHNDRPVGEASMDC